MGGSTRLISQHKKVDWYSGFIDSVALRLSGHRAAGRGGRAALAQAGAATWQSSVPSAKARRRHGFVRRQWQRIALAVRSSARELLLDEPTAQLDIRVEAEIFIKSPATQITTIISHRFSTVRHADRICVREHTKVVRGVMKS
jgi:ABC-type cobalamin/Fe3+-siderophores transport system ATPase subunit